MPFLITVVLIYQIIKLSTKFNCILIMANVCLSIFQVFKY